MYVYMTMCELCAYELHKDYGSNVHIFLCTIYAVIFEEYKFFTFVTGSERTHLPRTQQEDTLFTITR